MPASAAPERNPFMLMTHPEVVIAAMEKSERLSRLRRQICRPLDKGVEPVGAGAVALDCGAESAEATQAAEAMEAVAGDGGAVSAESPASPATPLTN